jgi:hypothetical protein
MQSSVSGFWNGSLFAPEQKDRCGTVTFPACSLDTGDIVVELSGDVLNEFPIFSGKSQLLRVDQALHIVESYRISLAVF